MFDLYRKLELIKKIKKIEKKRIDKREE